MPRRPGCEYLMTHRKYAVTSSTYTHVFDQFCSGVSDPWRSRDGIQVPTDIDPRVKLADYRENLRKSIASNDGTTRFNNALHIRILEEELGAPHTISEEQLSF